MKLLQVSGLAIAIILFSVSSNLTSYVFAQTDDLQSQMDTAKNAALAGMKQVKNSMKSGGLKAGMQSAKNVMKSSLSTVGNNTDQALRDKTKNKLQSQMDTAKDTAKAGMKEVKNYTKSVGLKDATQKVKNKPVWRCSLTGKLPPC
ncbi:MAG TPA: hypothetical protein VEJ68_05485 [Candidatus Bathyarchaeia archaeon]|nr:hypothetical protein [Candidatus Bathyarchaeia archaeon]